MEKSFLLRHFLFISVLVFLLFPVVYLPYYVPLYKPLWDPFFLQVAQGALVQSVLSTIFTLVLGTIGVFGIFSVREMVSEKLFQLFQLSLFVPSFIPPIIIVALGAKILGFLPTELVGVVFFHCLMNMGLVSLLLYRLIERKAGCWVREARLYGVSLFKFFIFYLLREFRHHYRWWSFYFFILYFFSFSIPFLVGGSLYGGIEVFIYEKILFHGQWSEALQYSLLLFLALFIISRFVREPNSRSQETIEKNNDSSFLHWKPMIGLVCFPVVFLFTGLFASLLSSVAYLGVLGSLEGLRGSLVVGLGVGLIVLFLLSVVTYCFVLGKLERFLLALVHPGWVFVGFAFLLFGGQGEGVDFLKIIFSLGIVYLPFLYRLHFSQKLHSLKQQVKVARSLGATWWRIYSGILWPQCLSSMALISGIAGMWACGDFALTGLLAQNAEVTTMAYEMKNLLSNYRIEQAILLLWPLLITSSVVFFAFQGITYVSGKKALS